MSAEKLPFQIPKSLASYVEQYEKKPDKTIDRFKRQLKRRGPDAVGFFVLAWFYHQKNEKEKALDCAIKAKALAPGSPFLEKAHYFFSHPDLFNAWRSDTTNAVSGYSDINFSSGSGLNRLIEKLSDVETKKIKIDLGLEGGENKNQQPYDKKEVDGIVSETLAKVHEKQGNNDTAIRMYKILRDTNKEKTGLYNEKIKKLEKLQASENNR